MIRLSLQLDHLAGSSLANPFFWRYLGDIWALLRREEIIVLVSLTVDNSLADLGGLPIDNHRRNIHVKAQSDQV